jgi:hypothetical protein
MFRKVELLLFIPVLLPVNFEGIFLVVQGGQIEAFFVEEVLPFFIDSFGLLLLYSFNV